MPARQQHPACTPCTAPTPGPSQPLHTPPPLWLCCATEQHQRHSMPRHHQRHSMPRHQQGHSMPRHHQRHSMPRHHQRHSMPRHRSCPRTALLPLPPAVRLLSRSQVVITDSLWPGKFLGFWARLSAPHPLVLLSNQAFPSGTCFTTALHSALLHGHSIFSRCVPGMPRAAAVPAGLHHNPCHDHCWR